MGVKSRGAPAARRRRRDPLSGKVASGAKPEWAQLLRVLAQLGAGDVLMVTRLDRLTRSTRDLLNTLASIISRLLAS